MNSRQTPSNDAKAPTYRTHSVPTLSALRIYRQIHSHDKSLPMSTTVVDVDVAAGAGAAGAAPIYEVDNCRNVLRVFSDGSIHRSPNPSFPVPIVDDGTVDWTDIEFSHAYGLHLRLYIPHRRSSDPPKLPLFFYFHGGGFCIGSRTWPNCQNYCLHLASELRAIIVAPDYRLSPEHRLPSALDDGAAAVLWLASPEATSNRHLSTADFDRVFISGDSAGGTIAHHLAVRFGSPAGRTALGPVRIRGYVLLMAFFGGTERMKSEAECPVDAFLNLELNDRFWRLSIPVGATVDHPLVNPFGTESEPLEGVEFDPMVVVVGGRDLLRDRAKDYARRLKEWGKKVEVVEFEGQQHGFFTIDPWSEASGRLMEVVRRFMAENSG